MEKSVIWQVCVDLLELLSPKPRVVARRAKEARVRMLLRLVGIVVRVDLMSSQCPKKKVHAVEESTTASQVGSQDTILVGSVGSYFDFGSVSEATREPRGADENICSMGASNVLELKSVDIEIDSGADVSCLPANNRRRHVSTGRGSACVEVTTLRLVAA